MRAVAAVPTEGKRFLTHENKPPLSSQMSCQYDCLLAKQGEESWENITVNMTTMRAELFCSHTTTFLDLEEAWKDDSRL